MFRIDLEKQKQWIEKGLLIIFGLYFIPYTGQIIKPWLDTQIADIVSVGTILGALALFAAYKVHKGHW